MGLSLALNTIFEEQQVKDHAAHSNGYPTVARSDYVCGSLFENIQNVNKDKTRQSHIQPYLERESSQVDVLKLVHPAGASVH